MSFESVTDTTNGAGTASPSGAYEFTLGCRWVSIYSIFSCVWVVDLVCPFVLFPFAIVLSVLLRLPLWYLQTLLATLDLSTNITLIQMHFGVINCEILCKTKSR